ncbi:MAG TPA: PqqD family protein [Candidatus Acidoferrum sp.]|nr:PqqD family protein [Candidatus Acidoferrum sp.]
MARPLSELPESAYSTRSLNTTPVRHTRNSAIVSREVAGETIVVPICRGVGDLDSVYTFNPVGRSLWRLLEDELSAEELANWVATHYEVDAKQALLDVQSYLAELQEIGLVRTV